MSDTLPASGQRYPEASAISTQTGEFTGDEAEGVQPYPDEEVVDETLEYLEADYQQSAHEEASHQEAIHELSEHMDSEDQKPEDERPEYGKKQYHEQTVSEPRSGNPLDIEYENTIDDDADIDGEHPPVTSLPADNNYDDSYDLFDERDNTIDRVVPDELRSDYSHGQSSTLATILWSVSILFLIATLFLEYIWFNRDSFAQNPQIQTQIEKLCKKFECDELLLRVPDSIELVSRNVYSHPNEKDGLIVDITMKNNAAFSQPYPILKIEFSDVRGQIIASRNFLPEEYLSIVQQNTESVASLPPETSSNITLEVKDPGNQALTYEFDFL